MEPTMKPVLLQVVHTRIMKCVDSDYRCNTCGYEFPQWRKKEKYDGYAVYEVENTDIAPGVR